MEILLGGAQKPNNHFHPVLGRLFEKNHIFSVTTNQNNFGHDKNRVLVQKGNVCVTF